MKDKSFKTYSEQLDSLINDKGLIVEDRAAAIDTLKHLSYFALVSGYKDPFRDETDGGRYKPGVKFEDIRSLYLFDVSLSSLYMRHLLSCERHLKSLYGYHFAQMFGEDAGAYLNPNSYDLDGGRHRADVRYLTDQLKKHAESPEEHDYVAHYQKHYAKVPIWILMHSVTFGELAHMYEYAKPQLRAVICTEFPGLKAKNLGYILGFLLRMRNTCAHSEPLYDLRTHEHLPVLGLHVSLGLVDEEKHTCTSGLNDPFAVLVGLRYMISDDEMKKFTQEIDAALCQLFSEDRWLKREQLLHLMGFPENWKEVATAPIDPAEARQDAQDSASAGKGQ